MTNRGEEKKSRPARRADDLIGLDGSPEWHRALVMRGRDPDKWPHSGWRDHEVAVRFLKDYVKLANDRLRQLNDFHDRGLTGLRIAIATMRAFEPEISARLRKELQGLERLRNDFDGETGPHLEKARLLAGLSSNAEVSERDEAPETGGSQNPIARWQKLAKLAPTPESDIVLARHAAKQDRTGGDGSVSELPALLQSKLDDACGRTRWRLRIQDLNESGDSATLLNVLAHPEIRVGLTEMEVHGAGAASELQAMLDELADSLHSVASLKPARRATSHLQQRILALASIHFVRFDRERVAIAAPGPLNALQLLATLPLGQFANSDDNDGPCLDDLSKCLQSYSDWLDEIERLRNGQKVCRKWADGYCRRFPRACSEIVRIQEAEQALAEMEVVLANRPIDDHSVVSKRLCDCGVLMLECSTK